MSLDKNRENRRIFNRKKVKDLLVDGPKGFEELVTASKLSRATISRILKEFKILKLVNNQNSEGKWTWFEYLPRFDTIDQFERALQHSRNLIRALSLLFTDHAWVINLGKISNQLSNLKECAEEHLKTGYVEIYLKLVKCRELSEKWRMGDPKQDPTFKNAKFIPGDTIELLKLQRIVSGSLVRRIFPEYREEKVNIPYAFEFGSYEEAKQALRNSRKHADLAGTKDGRYFILGPLYTEREKVTQFQEAHGELSKKIDMLILKIENGQPLNGKCELCPNFKIADTHAEKGRG